MAQGDVLPKRTIRSVQIAAPIGIALDLVNDEIVVTNLGYHSITTFDRLSSGESWPKRIIAGWNSTLSLPQGVALDPFNDEILVANSAHSYPNKGSILAFKRTDNGYDVAPLRRLEGAATRLCNPTSVALDLATNELVDDRRLPGHQ